VKIEVWQFEHGDSGGMSHVGIVRLKTKKLRGFNHPMCASGPLNTITRRVACYDGDWYEVRAEAGAQRIYLPSSIPFEQDEYCPHCGHANPRVKRKGKVNS
jgi:hypothetical protein